MKLINIDQDQLNMSGDRAHQHLTFVKTKKDVKTP